MGSKNLCILIQPMSKVSLEHLMESTSSEGSWHLFCLPERPEGRLSDTRTRFLAPGPSWDVDVHPERWSPASRRLLGPRRAGPATWSAGRILGRRLRSYRGAAPSRPLAAREQRGPGGRVYSNAADVTSSCGTWTEEKGQKAVAQIGPAWSAGGRPGGSWRRGRYAASGEMAAGMAGRRCLCSG